MPSNSPHVDLFDNLKPFLRLKSRPESCCELCGAGIGEHPHLLDMRARKIVCSCDACAILFSNRAAARYRRVPRDARFLENFFMSDAQWESLSIPINMAFFVKRADAATPAVYYPSPAGAIQSLLTADAWQEIVAANSSLQKMESEVECLLVNRITAPHEYYLAPIDECYRLVGLIRAKWRGFSGGTEAWKEIANFFVSLRKKAGVTGKGGHAESHLSA